MVPRGRPWAHFSERQRGLKIDYDVVSAAGFAHKYVIAPDELGARLESAMGGLQSLYVSGRPALPFDLEDQDAKL